MTFRTLLYTMAKAIGDVNAVKRHRVRRRIIRRLAGKVTARALSRLFR